MSPLLLALVAAGSGSVGVPTLVLPLRAERGTLSDGAMGQINQLYWSGVSALEHVGAFSKAAIPSDVASSIHPALPQCQKDECMGHLAGQAGFKRVVWGWVTPTSTAGFHVEVRLVDARGWLLDRAVQGCYACDEAALMGGMVDWDLSALDKPAPKQGLLYVSSRPKGAQVAIKGEVMGVTPLRRLSLDVGKHIVDVWSDGRKPLRKTVKIRAGRESRLGVKLKKLR